jgi:UDPglucose--hexose-1-phosphate uridylyltransferase
MRSTPIQLADGRELIYFDLPGDPPRQGEDTRELPPPPPASELRFDPMRGDWVAVAAHRQERTFQPPSTHCPLCPSTPEFRSEVPGPYRVVTFENRFPSFSDRTSENRIMPGIRPGEGRAEVMCFTPDHEGSFAELDARDVRLVLDVWAARTEAMSALPGVEQVFPFENRGEEIGVTLSHPHGQIYGYPFIPPNVRQILLYLESDPGAFGYRLSREQSDERVVAANEHWTAFVPRAARWPFEVHFYPHRQLPDIPALTEEERDAFAPLYLDVLRRFDALFDLPLPYIAAWFQAPVNQARETFRLHLQLFSIRRAPGKLKYLAASESAMGTFINDVSPEQAARMLRDALPSA